MTKHLEKNEFNIRGLPQAVSIDAEFELAQAIYYRHVDDSKETPILMTHDKQLCSKPGVNCAIWSNRLPVNIRAHISQKEFTKDSYKDVFDAADQVFLASKQVEVAAVSAGGLDETLPAFSTQNQPSEVAAVGKGSGKNKKVILVC